jgi:citrate lyase subunit beta/citryl-CoA lyase
MLRKAARSGADVVVFDLEDAVDPDAKAAARETVSEVLSEPEFDTESEVFVRVNELPLGEEDLDRVLAAPATLDGLVLPKVRTADDVSELADAVEQRGHELPVFALVETAAGVLHAESIAAVEATDALVFGAEDLAADIGATRTDDGDEVSYARQHVVLAARAGGIDAIDTIWTDIGDHDRLRTEAERAVEFGYDGKMAIHPDQIDSIHDAFAPDEDEIEWAHRVVAASEEHDGVFAIDGQMIDGPLIRQAQRLLDRADE